MTATVNLNKDDSGYFMDVTLNAELTGIDQAQAETLMARAHAICLYPGDAGQHQGEVAGEWQACGQA